MFLELTVLRKKNEIVTKTISLINFDKVVIFYPLYEGVRVETKNEVFDVQESYVYIKDELKNLIVNG